MLCTPPKLQTILYACMHKLVQKTKLSTIYIVHFLFTCHFMMCSMPLCYTQNKIKLWQSHDLDSYDNDNIPTTQLVLAHLSGIMMISVLLKFLLCS